MISTAGTRFTTSTHNQRLPRRLNLLAWLELAWLLVLSIPILLPGLIIDLRWQPILVLGLFALRPLHWLLQNKAGDPKAQFSATGWILTILLCWLPIPITMAVASTTWQITGYLSLGLASYLMVTSHPWFQKMPHRITQGLLLLSGILVFISPSIVQWKSEFRLFYLPLYDLFTTIALQAYDTLHANLLAGALVLLIPLTLAHLLPNQQPLHKLEVIDTVDGPKLLRIHQPRQSYQRLWKGVFAGLLVLMLTLLLLTQSRGGYIAITVAVGFLVLLRWPRLGYGAPVLITALGYSIYHSGGETIFAFLGADNTFGGADWRGPVWQASWQAFQDFGWTGIGIGNFQHVMPLLYPNPAINNLAATHAHNLLLQIGLDLGLPGLAAYLTFYLTIIAMAIAVLRRTHSPQSTATALGATWDGHALIAPPEVGVTVSTKRFIRHIVHQERTRQRHWAIATGCLAALIGMQIHGLLDAVTWGNKLAFLPWLIFAQITLLYHYHQPPTIPPETER